MVQIVELSSGPYKRKPRRKQKQKKNKNRNAPISTSLVAQERYRPPQRRRNNNQSASQLAVRNYINTINNPFDHGGCKLGWGTLVPTSNYTCYLRGSLTANADGSFGIGLGPSAGTSTNNIFLNNAGLAVATWTTVPFTNQTAIATAISEARVVSGGIRCMPQVPATGVPGILYAGSLPVMSNNLMTGAAINAYTPSPHFKVGYGATGASALIHPLDPSSFFFSLLPATGYAAGTIYDSSAAMILGTNFPASTIVYYEIVLNIEAITSYTSESSALTSPDLNNDDTSLSSYFPSVESMWKTVKRYCPTAAHVNTATSTIRDVSRIGNAAAFAYNSYNVNRRQRQEYFRIPQQNRVVIEEME